jgi:esterase
MKLYFRTLGEGEPLIILHGLFGSSDNWLTQAKIYSQYFKVYLYDARNHGQSEHSAEHNYKVLAGDLYQFIQEHNIINPFIIGHSMGGKTVMQFLIDYPNVAKKVVIADISPKFYPRHHEHILSGLHAIPVSDLNGRQEADDILSSYIQNVPERQFLLKNLYRTEQGQFAWRMNLETLSREIDHIGADQIPLKSISTPVFFLHGGNSNYLITQDYSLIPTLYTNSKIDSIPGTGHWLHAEKPAEFIEKTLTFFNE